MPYKLKVIKKPTYVHFIITGKNTVENVVQAFEEVYRESTARNCTRILVEERLRGPRLGFIDVFNIASEASARGRGFYKVIAYVDVYAPKNSLMKFAENTAVNRSLPLFVFSTVADAEKWLTKENQQGA